MKFLLKAHLLLPEADMVVICSGMVTKPPISFLWMVMSPLSTVMKCMQKESLFGKITEVINSI